MTFGSESARLQRLLIEVRHDDARLAAVRIGHLGAVHHRQCRADDVLAEIIERGVGQRVAGEA
jgi:hypothetical protein